ncbi:MAG: DUF302 domain-containing protein [Candidatus Thiodiazotropha sp.]|jgi:uncharacterized protein (DUF302 family)
MYCFKSHLEGDIIEIERRVVKALTVEGFGILSTIDIQATLKDKLGTDGLPYKILGVCNLPIAHQAIETEPDIGLLLPCNLVIREVKDGSVIVSFMDPVAVLKLVDQPLMGDLAMDVRQRLERVRDAIER